MLRTGMFGAGALCLAAGTALWIYGYNLEPTFGEAISNVFDKDFTDKRNMLIYSGVALTIVGALGVVGGVVTGLRKK